MRFADVPRYQLCHDRLCQRRDVVRRTLSYLDLERSRRSLDANSLGDRAYLVHRHKQFLDEVRRWYDAEANKIDAILYRLEWLPSSLARRHSRKTFEVS